MKTKNKLVVLLEISIVLCSVLVVSLPAIAAEQNQEMQEASANIATASKDDFVLGIYGNANEDDTIDMRDLTYVKRIFFGKKPETELADAKYDGKINPRDFIQIKLIIVGKESELTVVQYLGVPPDFIEEPVTVKMPIERIVSAGGYDPEMLCAFGAQNRIVGVAERIKKKRGELKIFLKDKPSIGDSFNWDLEKIIELKPDIVLTFSYGICSDYEEKLNAAGISLVQMSFYQVGLYSREVRNLGWMLGKQERAEEFINFEQQHINLITERVKDLEPEEKIRAYFVGYPNYYGVPTHTSGKGTNRHNDIELCGGINIFAEEKGYVTVDPEAVIVRNPQVIIASTASTLETGALGYDITDTSSVEKVRTDTIMNYPGFDHIDAVKNGRVYFISDDASSTHHCVWLSYMAKYFYPELFEDIDPIDIHREWLGRFLGIEFKGVYAYPPPASW